MVLALGGGTILDVAGYAAAQVRGGVKIVRIPTTPAAMMDAAFAEYAAVDSTSVKDALRVPSVPAGVLIDVTFASSVLDGVWRGGIGEAVRQAVVLDAALMKKLVKLGSAYCARESAALSETVKAVVASRLKKGSTAFAQWSALRLESMSGYKLPHGYAVPIGICLELAYAVEKGALKVADRNKVVELLRTCGALDGLGHSVHLLGQADNLLAGLDAWALSAGGPSRKACGGLGKQVEEQEVDREAMRKVLKELVSVPPKT